MAGRGTARDAGTWLSVGRAAELLGITTHTLREWTRQGIVAASRTQGGHRRYRRQDIEALAGSLGPDADVREARASVRELEVLSEISQSLFEQLDPDRLLEVVCARMLEALGSYSVVVSAYDAESESVKTLADVNADGTTTPIGAPFLLRDYPLTAQAVRTGEPVLTNFSDPDADPAEKALLEQYGNRSLLVVPMVFGGETIGTLEIVDRQEHHYSVADLSFHKRLAAMVAVALRNAQTFATLQRSVREMRIMNETTQALTGTFDTGEMLQQLADRLGDGLDVCRVYILERTQEGRGIRVVSRCLRRGDDGLAAALGEELSEGEHAVLAPCFGSRMPVRLTELDSDAPDGARAAIGERGERSVLYVPIVSERQVLGVVAITAMRAVRRFSEDDERVTTNIANKAGIALLRARMVAQLQTQNAEQQMLLRAARTISSSVGLQETLSTIAELLTATMDVAWSDVYLLREGGRQLEVAAYYQIPEVPPAEDYLGTVYDLDDWSDLRRCVETREPVAQYIDQPGVAEEYERNVVDWDEKSALTVPLLFRGEIIGLLDVAEFRSIRRFTESDTNLVAAIAGQAAAAISHARMLDETQRRASALETLLGTADSLRDTVELDELLSTLADRLCDVLGVTATEVYDYDESTRTLTMVAEKRSTARTEGAGAVRYVIDDLPVLRDCMEQRRAVTAYEDDPALPEASRAEMRRCHEIASLSVPLVQRDRAVGLLYLAEHDEPRRFTVEEARLATAIAAQAASAIENARAYASEQRERERLAQLNERLSALLEASGRMRGLIDEAELVDALRAVLVDSLGFRQWSLYLYEESDDSFRSVLSWGSEGPRQDRYTGMRVPSDVLRGLLEEAVPISRSFFVDHRLHRWTDEEHEWFPGEVLPGALADEWHDDDTLFVPLYDERGKVLGYIEPYDPCDGRRPAEETVRLLEVFALKAASALELRRLYGQLELQAITDGLTGLYNHRYLDDRLEQEFARAARYEQPLAVLMLDLDDFKRFNDTYGHPQGDKLLQGLAQILRAHTRENVDIVARYGGEEFVVVLPSTAADGAGTVADRLRTSAGDGLLDANGVAEAIRAATQDQRFAGYTSQPDVRVTVSVGVCDYPAHAATATELLANADKALYLAKRMGKNRVCVYEG